ncbi:MAG: hypothetical protein GEV09_04530 [Pseudonocardiaceae bacterium]|nr:hypothetical protein [Pseudonocardiaceae bacterium]
MVMRLLAAAAALVSAAVHLKLWIFDGYSDLFVVGPAFMLNAIAGVVIAGMLVFWRHWLPLLLVVGFGAVTLGAFVTSATVGLFGIHEQWAGWLVWTAFGSEGVAIVAGVLAAWREGYLSRDQLQQGLAGHGADLP